MDTRIVWFRRDLRLHDHPALHAALAGDRVVPLFVLDPRLVSGSTMSPARLSYLADALEDLAGLLTRAGGRLVLRRGDPREVLPAVAEEVGAGQAHWAGDVSPFAAGRDATVRAALEGAGVAVTVHPGVMIREPGSVVGGAGRMLKVYSPFRRVWEGLPLDDPLPAPGTVAVQGGVRGEDLPARGELAPSARVPPGVIRGGATAAEARLERFLSQAADGYAQSRDLLGEQGTSRLSADLHYGCLSPNAVYQRLDRRREGHDAFARELIWRDFYGHVMATWPEVRTQEFNEDLRGLPWPGTDGDLRAWQEGRTGYPVVDAGMRQLSELGWMHNRARMLTASFLCKDLLVDWREGAAFFLEHLVDGDLASNNGGWQWAASTGTDPQPWFRVFNPTRQAERFDPEGSYIRRWVPELAKVEGAAIFEPWKLSETDQKAAGVRVGTDYPAPIVAHDEARRRALARFGEIRRAR
jgi:deoxyribodipyrimidine photo-lyase